MGKQIIYRESTGWAVKSLRHAMSAWCGLDPPLPTGEAFDAQLAGCVRQFRKAYGVMDIESWEFWPCPGSVLSWFGAGGGTWGLGSVASITMRERPLPRGPKR